MATQPTHASNRILLPARNWFILLSIIGALLLDLIPVGRLPGIPDGVALVIAFWCIHQPHKFGMGSAFLLGFVVDAVHGSVLGQHALAYVLLAFFAGTLSRRILWFPLGQQALHVLPMLLGTQLVMLLTGMARGGEFPGLLWFLSSIVGALLWHPLTYLLLLPQYQPIERDDTRPI